jgi:hypothetical protein
MTKPVLPVHRTLLYQPPCLRREIRALLTRYQFPEATFKQVEDILVRQIRIARIYDRAVPATRFKNTQDASTHFDVHRFVWPRARGRRDQRDKRNHLFATLFRVWVIAFGEAPTINNKGFARTPFVQFAHLILRHEGIGKLEAHLESYQSYRKQTLLTLSSARD